MARITSNCEGCGQEIWFWPSQKRRFCSTACSGRATYRRLQQEGRTPDSSTHIKRGKMIPCEQCGKEFYRCLSDLALNKQRFCSQRCVGDASRKTKVIKQCEYCGKDFAIKPSQAQQRHCNRICDQLDRTKSWTLLDRQYNGMPVKQDPRGYTWLWEPTRAWKKYGGWYPEHRIVVEKTLGRQLEPDEQVHHINGVKGDNRRENLEVMSQRDHARLSLLDHIDFVKRELVELAEYRRLYGSLMTP